MIPDDRLIVALDGPVRESFVLAEKLRRVGVRAFKIGVRALVHPQGQLLAKRVGDLGAELMLDLKLFDTPDTVRATIAEASRELRPKFITVHVDCVIEAVRAARETCILAVENLTSGPPQGRFIRRPYDLAHGVICPPGQADVARRDLHRIKVIVCPGIRPLGVEPDNHVWSCTPSWALRHGADYIVVGRPIWQAADPVAAAQAILAEIEEVA